MDNLFAQTFDYRTFIFAMPFFMLAWQTAKMLAPRNASARWNSIVWFGLGFGMAEFIESGQYTVQAILALCAIGVWTGLTIYASRSSSPAGSRPALPIGSIVTAVVLAVAVAYGAINQDAGVSETGGGQTESVSVAKAEPAPRGSAQDKDQNWGQIMAERRQMGWNILKGAILTAVGLIAIYQCVSAGRGFLKSNEKSDSVFRRQGELPDA